jgi:Na+/H+-dicarboxylate symporter
MNPTAPWRLWARLPLWQQILIGLTLGVITGIVFKQDALVLAPIAALFLNAIKMLIVPLVFASLVAGRTAPNSAASVSRPSPSTWSPPPSR